MSLENIPKVGLGTYESGDSYVGYDGTLSALDIGYRLIDTAELYGNEEEIGKAIRDSDVPQEDVFLSTKTVHPPDLPGSEYDDIVEGVEDSIDRLDVDHVDLLYIHFPVEPVYDPDVALSALEEVKDRGLTSHLGICNAEPKQLEEAHDRLEDPLFALQVEIHPFLQQEHLVEYCNENGLWLVAYSPIARNEVSNDATIQDIATKHDASPVQISLAWLLSKDNVVAIPKSATVAHQRENFEAEQIDLDAEDIERIESIDRELRIIERDYGPWHG